MKYLIKIKTKRLYNGRFIDSGSNEYPIEAENSYRAHIEVARVLKGQGYNKGEVELDYIVKAD